MSDRPRVRPTCPTHDESGLRAARLETQGRSDLSDLSDQKLGVRRIDLRAALAAMRAAFQPEDARGRWLYEFHECAGFLEFDCGMVRAEAERSALDALVKRNEGARAEILMVISFAEPNELLCFRTLA